MRPATRTLMRDCSSSSGRLGGELRQNLFGGGVGELVFAAVRRLSEGLNLFQLFAPQFVNLVVECQGCPLGSCGKVSFDGTEIINNAFRKPCEWGWLKRRAGKSEKGRVEFFFDLGTQIIHFI